MNFQPYRSTKVKVDMIPSTILDHKILRDLIITAVQTMFKNDQMGFINFVQDGVLANLYGTYWTDEEAANLFMGDFDPLTASEEIFLKNLSRISAFDILTYLSEHEISMEARRTLIAEYERKVMKISIVEIKYLLTAFMDTLDELINVPLSSTLNTMFNKAPSELAEFGYRMAALGCQKFEIFIIEMTCRKGDSSKLARFVPPVLYNSLFARIVRYFQDHGQASEPLVSLLMALNGIYDQILAEIFTPLATYFCDLEQHLWFYEMFDQFINSSEESIDYSIHPELCLCCISLLDEVNRNMFQYPRGIRTLFQRICSTISDEKSEINLASFHWLTTCSLQRAKLPSSVFR